MYKTIPHPIPYQGSKRKLASKICSFFPKNIDCLIEPFAGSAAITLFAAEHKLAKNFIINDKQPELMELWELIINKPEETNIKYSKIWNGYTDGDNEYFNKIRERFNQYRDPIDLLYLIVRCVKNAIRFNKKGDFTQSADKRRKGTAPKKMELAINGASFLLKGKTKIFCDDYKNIITNADKNDFIYMDPPYHGTSTGQDRRYFSQVNKDDIIESLSLLNESDIRFILSYDGITGDIEYTEPLPEKLMMKQLLIDAGRSSQSTLNGNNHTTFESLYLSKDIQKKISFQIKTINEKEYSLAF